MRPANDNSGPELEQALARCPKAARGALITPERHRVMMAFGAILGKNGEPLWPDAARYRHVQIEFDEIMSTEPERHQ